jgi:uncharacterized protein YifE (UPF0438 family)
MKKNIQRGRRIKEQLNKFITRVLPDAGKIGNRFIREMSYGILKSGDVKTSNIARALDEEIDISDTVKRLYNNNSGRDYSKMIESAMVKSYHRAFDDDTVIAIDHTDLTKPYAEKMENLTIVRDGDKGRYGKGYNHVVITATQLGADNPVVIANNVWSKKDKFESAKKITQKTLNVIGSIRDNLGKKGIRVCDRFFDSKHYFKEFEAHGEEYVIRAKVNRKMLRVVNGKVLPGKVNIVTLARGCKTRFSVRMRYWKNGEWKPAKTVRIGCRKVFLPCINKIITMVVIKGFGKVPMMLLTNNDIAQGNHVVMERILKVYRARWICEEFIRFVKTEYSMEDIRCLKYQALKNTLGFLLLVTNFITKHIGYSRKIEPMKLKIIAKAKAIFENNAKLLLYRIAAGIRELLEKVPAQFGTRIKTWNDDLQMELPL